MEEGLYFYNDDYRSRDQLCLQFTKAMEGDHHCPLSSQFYPRVSVTRDQTWLFIH